MRGNAEDSVITRARNPTTLCLCIDFNTPFIMAISPAIQCQCATFSMILTMTTNAIPQFAEHHFQECG